MGVQAEGAFGDGEQVGNWATAAPLRHTFATHRLMDGYGTGIEPELSGYERVRTSLVDTHVLGRGGRGVRSPLDRVGEGDGRPQAN